MTKPTLQKPATAVATPRAAAEHVSRIPLRDVTPQPSWYGGSCDSGDTCGEARAGGPSSTSRPIPRPLRSGATHGELSRAGLRPFRPRDALGSSAQDPLPVHNTETCRGDCERSDCTPRSDLLALTHPATWLGLLSVPREPLPLETYRVITYDPEGGVQSVRSFQGLIRVIQARSRSEIRQPALRHVLHKQTLLHHEIVDSRNDVRGVVGLRRDGTWITALDTDGDGVADVMHLVTRDGLGHIFANERGRDALRDWMDLGRNPFCVPGLNLSDVRRAPGTIPGCPSSNRGGPTLNPGATAGTATPRGVPGASPADLFCRDVAEGGTPPELAGGGQRANSPTPVPKVMLTGRRNFPSQPFTSWYVENIERRTSPMHTPSDRETYDPMQVEEDLPLRMPPEEEKPPPGVTVDVEVGPIKIYPSTDSRRNQNSEGGTRSRPVDGHESSELLSRLCDHWRDGSESSSLISQLREALDNNCIDPAGNPDPEGRTGSVCAGFRVERLEDLLGFVGGTDCVEYEGQAGSCEPTSIRDRLAGNARRHWTALERLEVVEACNPMICQPGVVSNLERRHP